MKNISGVDRQLGEIQIEDMQSRHVLEKQYVQPLSTSTTPDVLNKRIFEANNTAPVTITDFLNGAVGQRIYILGDGFTTIEDGTFIKTATGANRLLAADKVYTFTFFEIVGPPKTHKWVEDVDDSGGGGGGLPEFYSTGLLNNSVAVNPRPVVDTDFPDLSVTIAASNVERIFLVTAHVFTTLGTTTGNNARIALFLDSNAVFNGGNNPMTSNKLIFIVASTNDAAGRSFQLQGVPVTVPGDGVSHTISLKYNAVGSTTSITFVSRFLTALQVA